MGGAVVVAACLFPLLSSSALSEMPAVAWGLHSDGAMGPRVGREPGGDSHGKTCWAPLESPDQDLWLFAWTIKSQGSQATISAWL